MLQIFVAYADAQEICAERIRRDLEAAGYRVWRGTADLVGSPSYARAIENGIRGSAAVIVIWSDAAAASEWIEREVLFAQRLRKPILPVLTDDAEPGILLVTARTFRSTPSCVDAAAQLLSHLPQEEGELQRVAALLTHERISRRKEGIERARDLLAEGRHREELLALLENVSRADLMLGVRELAQSVVADQGAHQPATAQPDESRHIFPVRCQKGHISYFDRRILCTNKTTVKRSSVRRGGADLTEMALHCEKCGEDLIVRVDCEGYQ